MNWIIISVVVFFAIVLIVYLAMRNLKDEKDLEQFLNEKELATGEDVEEDELNNMR